MASPSVGSLRSPFEKFSNILPEGHDKALKQAFYNTAATLFAVVVCGAAVAVYYILEAFLQPLLWAVLCGTFLHPFKNTLTTLVQRWLQSLRKSGTPFLIGIFILPFQIINSLSDKLGDFLTAQWKVLLAAVLGLPALYLVYHFGPLQQIFSIFMYIFYFLYDALGYFSAIWVWTLAAAYALVVIFLWTPERSRTLKLLSIPVWFALVFHGVTVAGPLRVPLLILVVTMMIVGLITELKHANKADSGECASFATFIRILSGTNDSTSEATSAENSVNESSDTTETVRAQGEKPDERPEVAVRPSKLPDMPRNESPPPDPATSQPERSLSDMCFIGLFWAIVLTLLWKHIWIMSFLPLLIGIFLVKKLASKFGGWAPVEERWKSLTKTIMEDGRFDLLAPKPVRGLSKLILKGDKKVVLSIEQSMDKTVSILVVLLLLFGTVFMVFFSAVQVHRESMHLVTVTSNVLNKSLDPDLVGQWIPKGEDMQNAVDSMVGNAYLYGRQWITDKLINSAMNVDDARKSHVEKQVLELWDRAYEAYFARNTSKVAPPLERRNSLIDLTNISNLWDIAQKAEDFDLNIVDFAKENIGTFMSVLESVWLVLKGNISLVLNLLTATISLVFGGGTAILNFVLAFVVFITTLFYLLALSGDTYKPVEWFTSISPTQGSGGTRFGKTVEEAISSVFVATFKMSVFYGLYTWVTHTLFGVQIVFIPAALAALCAGIPFLGTYWASVPAVLELWLVHGENVKAVLLLVCHFLPTYIVDTAIYSEIKGGHPFMTGLAIAGGMYWLGLEGAIIGPVLLCCLVVAVNIFSTMLKPDPPSPIDRVRQSGSSMGKRE